MERINGFKRFLVLRIAAKRAATNEDFARFAAVYDTMTKEGGKYGSLHFVRDDDKKEAAR